MVVSIVTTFLTSSAAPYLINADYANLGGKLGYIYGAINILVLVGVFFFIPELKFRSLEEVDQFFESGVALRKFKSIETRGVAEMYEECVPVKARTEGLEISS
jgi:MFS transporter, SP family, sugar:H+ symporter